MAFQEDSIYWVEVEKVVPNPFQPRREFDEDRLKELSESIRMYGVLQPLTVTRNEVQRDDGTFYTEYELIAGERRLRASRLAGLSQVPVIIREGRENEQEKLELAIIENLQREDLNSVDRALAFQQLAETFGLTHTQVAKKVGRSREYVSNTIRLLALPAHMLDHLRAKKMTEGHARTLLMLSDRPEEQEVLFREMILKKLSVREVEKIARRIATDKVRKKDPEEFDDKILDIERQFTESLGTRVQIQKTNFGGKLTIDYFSLDDLEQLLVKVRNESLELGPSIYHRKAETLSDSTALEVETSLEGGEDGKVDKYAGYFGKREKKEKKEEKQGEENDILQIRPDNFPKVFEKKEVIEYREKSPAGVLNDYLEDKTNPSKPLEQEFSHKNDEKVVLDKADFDWQKKQKAEESEKRDEDKNVDEKNIEEEKNTIIIKEEKPAPVLGFKTSSEVEEEKIKKRLEAERVRLEKEHEEWLKKEEEKKIKIEQEREERERREKIEQEWREREEQQKLEEKIRLEEEERKKREEIRRLEEIASFTAPKISVEEKPKVEEISREEQRQRAEEAWLESESFAENLRKINLQKSVSNSFLQETEKSDGGINGKTLEENSAKNLAENQDRIIGEEKVVKKPQVVTISQNKSIYNPQTKMDNYSDGYSSFSRQESTQKTEVEVKTKTEDFDFTSKEESFLEKSKNLSDDDEGDLYSVNNF